MFRTVCLTTTVLGAASIALCVFRPAWAVHAGLDLWNLPELERNLAAQEELRKELEQKDELIVERITVKESIVRELLAERLMLAEAAARFRRLNAELPSPGNTPDYFPGETENERYCRQVLQWVEVEIRSSAPGETEEVLCRLEAELATLLVSQDGAVAPPEI